MSDTSAARRFARYAAGLRTADLPRPVIEKVTTCLLDMLSCAFTARDLPWSSQAVSLVKALSALPEATVIGTEVRTTACDAAFANAIQANGLIREDMHTPTASHLGVVVLPTALAVAEARHATGAELIAAIVAGYQVMGRLGRVLIDGDNARRFRPTALLGPIGAAVTAGRLFRLQEDAAVSALGLAGNLSGGLNEWAHSGAQDLFFQSGFAARNGITASSLAALGATASESILEGEAGLLAAFGATARAARLGEDLDGDFEILAVYHKPAPACNYVQTPCQAALDVATRERMKPEEIQAIEVLTFPAARAYPGCDHPGPIGSMIQAKMSIQWSVASVLARRELAEDNFRRFDDPEISRLAARVKLSVDPELGAAYPSAQGAEIRVHLVDGRVVRARLRDVRAASAAEVRTRFRAAATGAVGERRATEIEKIAEALGDLDDVAILMKLLTC